MYMWRAMQGHPEASCPEVLICRMAHGTMRNSVDFSTPSSGVMSVLARTLLIISGLYWGLLIYSFIDSCGGGASCMSSPWESLLWAAPAALVFWLPAFIPSRLSFWATLIRALSTLCLIGFLLFLGWITSWFGGVSHLFNRQSWVFPDLLLSSLPLSLLFTSLLVLAVPLARRGGKVKPHAVRSSPLDAKP